MKQALISLLLLLLTQSTLAQRFEVEAFHEDPSDLSAIRNERTNINDEKCAIIKVRSNIDGLQFDSNLGITEIEYKTGEVWLYVSPGERALKFMCTGIVTMDYNIPAGIRIEPSRVYILELVATMAGTPQAEIKSQWLLITVEPNTALIFLNENFEAIGTLQKRLKPGTYNYRIENHLYHAETGIVELSSDMRAELSLNLYPNFGFLEVKSTPETGARVLIDGNDAGFITNGISNKIPSGKYTVSVIKENFQPVSQQVLIIDNETTSITLDMAPNFAIVEVILPEKATLFINNQRRAFGSWKGQLSNGIHLLEAKKHSYHTDKKEVQVVAGEEYFFTLDPKPIVGSIDVLSKPTQANVRLNGENYGMTPITINNLKVGEYLLILEKLGYLAIQKSITVSEGGITLINEELPVAGIHVEISSEPSGVEVYAADIKVGETPYYGYLPFGNQSLKLINGSKIIQDMINIYVGGKTYFFYDFTNFKPPGSGLSTVSDSKPRIGDNINIEMIFVEGGDFLMGCIVEHGNECLANEFPTSQVTLTDYYIGKFEITVGQFRRFIDDTGYLTDAEKSGGSELWNGNAWEIVPGINWGNKYSKIPRPLDEKEHPVVFVSWNDAVAYCKWLSDLSGKSYRLPTEAEWEYAARGGRFSKNFIFSGSVILSEVAYFWKNSGTSLLDGEWDWNKIVSNNCGIKPVGQKQPNEIGVFDMSGNAWEWCSDWFGDYSKAIKQNPLGPVSGNARVVRGGGFSSGENNCRVSFRNSATPETRRGSLGFRIVMEVD